MTSFADFGLAAPILKALATENHTVPTPIQSQAIPPVIAGHDLLGIAQTGTGKTAAFALPILHRLASTPRTLEAKTCRVLVLSPTRELSNQTRERFDAYGRLLRFRSVTVIGGVSIGSQVRSLAGGVEILIATPGRLLDLMGTGAVRLDAVEVLVLDEADRMLDMGFIPSIRQIVAKLPKIRQNLFFSATMPSAISGLAKSLLRDPVTVAVTPVAKTADKVEQAVIFVQSGGKMAALAGVLAEPAVDRALVFSRTKRGADRIVRGLAMGGVPAEAIHGNKSQPQRERVLASFRQGKIRVLVATDIAARGIDVANITHVINYDLPNEPESYVHRIGRTARAGAGGIAISLCEGGDERQYLRDIEKLIRQSIPVRPLPAAAPRGTAWTPPMDEEAPAQERQRQRPPRRRPATAATGDLTAVAFLNNGRAEQKPAGDASARQRHASGDAERNDRGKGRAPRIRRRRNGGPAGRQLLRAAG